MFIDIHCHLDMCENADLAGKNAEKNKILVLSNGVNAKSNRRNLEISEVYENVKVALGVYPIDALKLNGEELEKEINFIRENKDKIIAIGEVGMDFKESDEKEKQEEIFRKFVLLALEINKPIIVHSRKAEQECIEILEDLDAKKVIMHCFSGSMKLVERIVKNDWFLTIPTNVTFSEHFQNVARKVDLKNLFCETDSPYLHPQKKWPNEPSNVAEAYKKIAEVKNIPLEEIEKRIEENYRELFN